MKEMVYHPDHYNKEGRKECWEEMIDKFGKNAVIIFDMLSAYKYLYRCGEKDGNPKSQEVKKIENYLKHANELRKVTDTSLISVETIVNNAQAEIISQLITNIISSEEVKQEETEQEEAVPEEKKEETTKKKEEVKKNNKPKRIDYGKIEALYNAGWTPKKIGDEIGMSNNSVSVAIHKIKNGLVNWSYVKI